MHEDLLIFNSFTYYYAIAKAIETPQALDPSFDIIP